MLNFGLKGSLQTGIGRKFMAKSTSRNRPAMRFTESLGLNSRIKVITLKEAKERRQRVIQAAAVPGPFYFLRRTIYNPQTIRIKSTTTAFQARKWVGSREMLNCSLGFEHQLRFRSAPEVEDDFRGDREIDNGDAPW